MDEERLRIAKQTARELAESLPFRVGQTVETRSFESGYRGAWFECTIVEIDRGSRSYLRYKLKYVHFEDEGLHWCKAYQQRKRFNANSTELMLRPIPPPVIREEDLRGAMYDGIVIIPYAWEVGDLVDWWCDDVWWEATVNIVYENGKVQIKLLKPPFGEGGGAHVVESVDLRPSLAWSLADQWTLPVSPKKANHRPAASVVDLSTGWWSKAALQQENATTMGNGSSAPGFGLAQEPNHVPNIGDERHKQTKSAPLEVELGHQRFADVLGRRDSDCKIVPCLDMLRRAVGPTNFVSTNGADEGKCAHDEILRSWSKGPKQKEKNHLWSISRSKDPMQEEKNFTCTSSDTWDDDRCLDDKDLTFALHLKWLIFRRRQRKFKRYRICVNKAVEFSRRLRLKTYIFADCSILDSPDVLSWDD